MCKCLSQDAGDKHVAILGFVSKCLNTHLAPQATTQCSREASIHQERAKCVLPLALPPLATSALMLSNLAEVKKVCVLESSSSVSAMGVLASPHPRSTWEMRASPALASWLVSAASWQMVWMLCAACSSLLWDMYLEVGLDLEAMGKKSTYHRKMISCFLQFIPKYSGSAEVSLDGHN